jgi:DNA-binding Lrp family transcriptional regulator
MSKVKMMDETDRKILNLIQEEFPLTERPFAKIGKSSGIEENEAIERVRKLKSKGYIRRIGPVLDPKKLEYMSTLCGVHVDEDKLMDVVEEINTHSGVTHNYEREGELNVWFTITAETEKEIEGFLVNLEERFSLKIYAFPKKRIFKIKTFFQV